VTPFKIEGPALISFSGGRTSGMMLHHIIQAHGGTLPDDVKVCFQNTGKERLETLDFIRDCADHWDVKIHWLERDGTGGPQAKFREVTYATAARNGEPFDELISIRRVLPNPVARYCTGELKIDVMRDFAYSLGWRPPRGETGWDNVVGLRYDEPERVANIRNGRERTWGSIAPLHSARKTKRDVAAFWKAQNFGLNLPNINNATPAGNCDLCFLKGAKTLSALMRQNPGMSDWWIAHEGIKPGPKTGAYFRRNEVNYQDLQKAVDDQDEFDFGDADSLGDCFCTD